MSSCHKEASSTFRQQMSQCRLTERQCNQEVSDTNHLENLSRSGCKQWKSLPPHLELEATVAEDIDKSQKEERERRDMIFSLRGKRWFHLQATHHCFVEDQV